MVTISGKHIDMTEAMKARIEEKTAKLPRYYNSINEIEVIVDGKEAGNVSVEIIARAEHNRSFIASEQGLDMYACVDEVVRKVERQLSRHKEKERNNKHSGSSAA